MVDNRRNKKECNCVNGKCQCRNCQQHKHCGAKKLVKLKIALLLGVAIGTVVGVKYHKELTKTAFNSWDAAQKNSKKYAGLSEKQLKKLSKEVKKKLNK